MLRVSGETDTGVVVGYVIRAAEEVGLQIFIRHNA